MKSLQPLWLPILAMAVVIVFTFPFAFLITDLTNRFHGVANARKVVFAGFGIGVVASLIFADPRIAVASGAAFLTAQMVDVGIFNKLRDRTWWIAPFTSSVISTVLDTWLFFFLAFVATGANGIFVLKNRVNPASA